MINCLLLWITNCYHTVLPCRNLQMEAERKRACWVPPHPRNHLHMDAMWVESVRRCRRHHRRRYHRGRKRLSMPLITLWGPASCVSSSGTCYNFAVEAWRAVSGPVVPKEDGGVSTSPRWCRWCRCCCHLTRLPLLPSPHRCHRCLLCACLWGIKRKEIPL